MFYFHLYAIIEDCLEFSFKSCLSTLLMMILSYQFIASSVESNFYTLQSLFAFTHSFSKYSRIAFSSQIAILKFHSSLSVPSLSPASTSALSPSNLN